MPATDANYTFYSDPLQSVLFAGYTSGESVRNTSNSIFGGAQITEDNSNVALPNILDAALFGEFSTIGGPSGGLWVVRFILRQQAANETADAYVLEFYSGTVVLYKRSGGVATLLASSTGGFSALTIVLCRLRVKDVSGNAVIKVELTTDLAADREAEGSPWESVITFLDSSPIVAGKFGFELKNPTAVAGTYSGRAEVSSISLHPVT